MRKWFRIAWRTPVLFFWILGGLFTVLVVFPLTREPTHRFCIEQFSRGLLRICGIRLAPQGAQALPKPSLVVANHVSWIDIYVMLALDQVTFIAKSDIQKWPLVGRLVSSVGTLYIDRKNRAATQKVVLDAEQRFRKGERVMFFPEGTTSDGMGLLPFKAALFSLVERSPEVPVITVTHRYWSQGKPSTIPAYIGEMSLVGSITQIIGHTQGLTAEPVIHGELPRDQAMDRRAIAEAARLVIGRQLGLTEAELLENAGVLQPDSRQVAAPDAARV